jgi:thiol-disulfide isomerase/thioredoxin
MVSLQAALAAIVFSGIGQTVLLDFYSDACGPCKAMNPTVQALANAGYSVQRINITTEPKLAMKYGVQRVPCFVMLVNGREVDRVVGKQSYSRLEQMCKMGSVAPLPKTQPAMVAQNAPPAGRDFSDLPGQRPAEAARENGTLPFPATASASAAPFDGWATQPKVNQPTAQPSPQPAQSAPAVPDTALVSASVRLRIEDPTGHSCVSGTIIDARGGEALILTCGHGFRESQGKGKIEVDLFGPNGPQRVIGRMISYDSETRDIGVVAIPVSTPVAVARVAPPRYRISSGMPVMSVGCNNGGFPTVQHSQINSLNKFVGPPTIQVAGQPVEGRSGGGLFSAEGYIIGVCNAADPSDKEGLFAALGSIYAELDRKDAEGRSLSFVYQESGGDCPDFRGHGAEAVVAENGTVPFTVPAVLNPAALAANRLPAVPQQTPASANPVTLASANEPIANPSPRDCPDFRGHRGDAVVGENGTVPFTASALPPHEQAALDEVQRRVKGGWNVTIVVSSRDNPEARSEVYQLDRATSGFVKQFQADSRPKDNRVETSLELPTPRKTILEWSVENERAKGK